MKLLGFDMYPDAGNIHRAGPDLSAQITCEIVGENSETICLHVPPGQVRALSLSAWFPGSPPIKYKLAWMLVLNWVEAR